MKAYRTISWLLVGGICCWAAAAWMDGPAAAAAAPTTRPAPATAAAQPPPGPPRRFSGPPPRRFGPPRLPPPDWNNFMKFMRENAPNRYLLLQEQETRLAPRMRQNWLQRWRNIVQLKHNQQDLFGAELSAFKQEDVLVGLMAQLRQATSDSQNPDRQRIRDLKKQIVDAMGQLVEFNLKARSLRIQQAEKIIAQQKAQLKRDEKNKQRMALMRAAQIIRRAEDMSGRPDPGDPPNP
jgi:phenylpropionate dioxygenase-like ring-hydroxylating dioxygenase large terminal subunit